MSTPGKGGGGPSRAFGAPASSPLAADLGTESLRPARLRSDLTDLNGARAAATVFGNTSCPVLRDGRGPGVAIEAVEKDRHRVSAGCRDSVSAAQRCLPIGVCSPKRMLCCIASKLVVGEPTRSGASRLRGADGPAARSPVSRIYLCWNDSRVVLAQNLNNTQTST